MTIQLKKRLIVSVLLAVFALLPVCPALAQTFTTLHSFTGASTTGNPFSVMVVSGNTLYGTSSGGGVTGNGAIFRMNTDGTGLTNIYTFTGAADGSHPQAALTLSGNVLYGTAYAGGASGSGTIFKINTNGTGFTILYTFLGGNDGAGPKGAMVLSGNTLYGTTCNGGSAFNGTIFQINTDGTDYTNLYTFPTYSSFDGPYAENSGGMHPQGTLTLSGNTIYGTATDGGSGGWGTVFKFNIGGAGFATVHNFGFSDGAFPPCGLTLSGSVLYGVASQGGGQMQGTVFKLNTDGSGFTTLHTFLGSDGSYPDGELVVSSNLLFGTTLVGGASLGTAFEINTNSSGYTILYNFGGTNINPYAGLVLSSNILYGTANTPNGNGVVFEINTNSLGYTVLQSLINGSDGASPQAGLLLSSNILYGTTADGGSMDFGSIFQVKPNGTGFATLYNFTDQSDGAYPQSPLVSSGNFLYGMTPTDDNESYGTIFQFNMTNGSLTTLYSFSIGDNGFDPVAGLALSGNTLYGATSEGGSGGSGVIFQISTNGNGYTNVYTFTAYDPSTGINSDGASPQALLLSGSAIYGTTIFGGSLAEGTVFALNTNGANFMTLHSFSAGNYNDVGYFTNGDGTDPQGQLVLSGKTLYGTASYGGAYGAGTVFEVNTDGTGFAVLHAFSDPSSFINSDGANPMAGLIVSGNVIYGTTSTCGSTGNGTVFQVNTDGTQFKTLYNFTDGNDGSDSEAGLILSSNTLYGTASDGGNMGQGTVFSLFVPPQLALAVSGPHVIVTWPTNCPGFTLQSSTSLSTPLWNPVSPQPSVINGQEAVTNLLSVPPQFYRLIR